MKTEILISKLPASLKFGQSDEASQDNKKKKKKKKKKDIYAGLTPVYSTSSSAKMKNRNKNITVSQKFIATETPVLKNKTLTTPVNSKAHTSTNMSNTIELGSSSSEDSDDSIVLIDDTPQTFKANDEGKSNDLVVENDMFIVDTVVRTSHENKRYVVCLLLKFK